MNKKTLLISILIFLVGFLAGREINNRLNPKQHYIHITSTEEKLPIDQILTEMGKNIDIFTFTPTFLFISETIDSVKNEYEIKGASELAKKIESDYASKNLEEFQDMNHNFVLGVLSYFKNYPKEDLLSFLDLIKTPSYQAIQQSSAAYMKTEHPEKVLSIKREIISLTSAYVKEKQAPLSPPSNTEAPNVSQEEQTNE